MTVKPDPFNRTRAAHTREKAEDYVELIQELIKKNGEARLTDVAKRFGVSTVTAFKIINRLQRENLITAKPYRALFLTAKGEKLALKSHSRHEIVYRFLKKLGVPTKIAQIDAEGMEHHVSKKTLAIFKKFIAKKI